MSTTTPCCRPRSSIPDLTVIGAGSAGFSAAITAAEAGATVLMVGAGTIGGTCVNVGCVPSKTLIRAMEGAHQARFAARFAGLSGTAELGDWAALVAQKNQLVRDLRRSKYQDLLATYDTITYVAGRARFTARGLEIDGHPQPTRKILIATGARPTIPDIPGIDTVAYMTSTEALELSALPRSMLVLGGGYIGCELAQLFARAGVSVTLVCRRGLLPDGEPELSAALSEALRAEGITIVSGIRYERVGRDPEGNVTLTLRRGAQTVRLAAEKLLLATGRTPNTDGLGLADAGVALRDTGAIVVDAHMQTGRPEIFAAGDVTGSDQFVYMAAYGAKLAARNAIEEAGLTYDNSAMPAVVFTDPQVACVGLTERAALAAGHKVKTTTLPVSAIPRALANRDTRGVIKLVAEADSLKLLGAHIIAPDGADSIQTAALAIKAGMSAPELGDALFPYLTTVEGLKLAAQTFERDLAKLSCCAG